MLTVRVLPRRGVTLRAAVATVETTAVLAAGHLWAGGQLPSVPWLLVMAGVVLGAGIVVLHGRVSPRIAVPLLVVTQLLLHAWLTTLTTGSGATGAMTSHGAHDSHAQLLLDPSMLLVHVGGGLLTALLWELRARAADVMVTWTREPPPPLPSLRQVPAPVPSPLALLSRFVLAAAPRRGPPVPAVAA